MTTPSTSSPIPEPTPDATARPRRRFRLFRPSAQTIQDRLDARHTDPDDLQRARAARAADLIGVTHHPTTDTDADTDADAGSGAAAGGDPADERPVGARTERGQADAGSPAGAPDDAIGRMHAALDELPDPAQLDRLADLAGLDQPNPRAHTAAADLDDRGNATHQADLRAGHDAGDDDGTGR